MLGTGRGRGRRTRARPLARPPSGLGTVVSLHLALGGGSRPLQFTAKRLSLQRAWVYFHQSPCRLPGHTMELAVALSLLSSPLSWVVRGSGPDLWREPSAASVLSLLPSDSTRSQPYLPPTASRVGWHPKPLLSTQAHSRRQPGVMGANRGLGPVPRTVPGDLGCQNPCPPAWRVPGTNMPPFGCALSTLPFNNRGGLSVLCFCFYFFYYPVFLTTFLGRHSLVTLLGRCRT